MLLRHPLPTRVPEAGRPRTPSSIHVLSQVLEARAQVSSLSPREASPSKNPEQRSCSLPRASHVGFSDISKFINSV